MGSRIRVVAAALLAAMAVATSSAVATDGHPTVVALYYPWYNLDTWADPMLSDRPAEPYHSGDPATIARHVEWARAAGIDVLVSAWFGPAGRNPTETNFQLLLDAAGRSGLKAAILLEADSPDFFPSLADQQAALSHALSVHALHPAYFRYAEKPVIFVWRPRAVWVGDARAGRDGAASVEAWRALRNFVDPERSSVWIAEGEFVGYLDVFDGLFPYNVSFASDLEGYLQRLGNAVRGYSAQTGAEKLWVATAMPGYDDTGLLDRRDRYAVSREDGAYYQRSFAAAVASEPNWINISSFNEWVEGHQIEPSVTYGDLYLRLTEQLVADWRIS